ncbi:MAG: hypothetical protein WKG00_18645 [Polyangiaceae bacterium]
MIQVTFDELTSLGGEPRIGAEFETAMLDLLPGRFRVVRLSAHRAELNVVAWRTSATLHPDDARRQRVLAPCQPPGSPATPRFPSSPLPSRWHSGR